MRKGRTTVFVLGSVGRVSVCINYCREIDYFPPRKQLPLAQKKKILANRFAHAMLTVSASTIEILSMLTYTECDRTSARYVIINNYWMRLSMISGIIRTEVYVICRSRRLRQITQTRGFDNSWYHAKTEFNNCFIILFSHNSSSETEAKHSAILFLRRKLQGA